MVKIIAGFDCAIKNLGICYIEYNDEWKNDIDSVGMALVNLYKQAHTFDNELFMTKAIVIINRLNDILNSIIKIIYLNVIDLVPGVPSKKATMLQRTKSLKALLHALDKKIKPDIVLIEYQMRQNDISRAISHQILYHYADFDNCDVKCFVKSDQIDLQSNIVKNIEAELCGTTIKNSYALTEKGEYTNFIERYTNYTANKKHTDFNFKYFIKLFAPDRYDEIMNLKNKTNDIADAFMMIFGWLKKHALI